MEEDAPEGVAFQGVAQPNRTQPAAIALAAIAVVAIALLTRQLAPSATVATADGTAQPSTQAITSSRPAAAPASPPTSGPPSRNPDVTPHPTFVVGPAQEGTTQLVPAGPTTVRLTISLPRGWHKASDAMFVKSIDEGRAVLTIGAWRLRHVYAVPCRWASSEYADPPLMRTAEGQATALSSWWGQDPTLLPYWNSRIAPLAYKPQPTTIRGYQAWFVQVLVPSDVDLTECDGEQFVLWDTADGDVRYSSGPSELIHLWVVDVDGQIIVIDAATSDGLVQDPDLQSMVDSIVIEP